MTEMTINQLAPTLKTGKRLILIRGIPGAGKTTAAHKLNAAMGGVAKIHTTDDWFERDGTYNFDPNQLGRAHQWNHDRTDDALSKGHTVIVPNTMVKQREINQYLRLADKHGVEAHVLVATHNGQNIHGVPDHALDRMRSNWYTHPGEIHLKEDVAESLIEAKIQSR